MEPIITRVIELLKTIPQIVQKDEITEQSELGMILATSIDTTIDDVKESLESEFDVRVYPKSIDGTTTVHQIAKYIILYKECEEARKAVIDKLSPIAKLYSVKLRSPATLSNTIEFIKDSEDIGGVKCLTLSYKFRPLPDSISELSKQIVFFLQENWPVTLDQIEVLLGSSSSESTLKTTDVQANKETTTVILGPGQTLTVMTK